MFESPRKPTKCPNCGAKTVATILYGYPIWSPELDRKISDGKIVLGGCCVLIHEPKWRCTSCEAEIHKSTIDGFITTDD